MQSLGDARLMINKAKIQNRKIELEIARLTSALREATKKAESKPKKRLIDYH